MEKENRKNIGIMVILYFAAAIGAAFMAIGIYKTIYGDFAWTVIACLAAVVTGGALQVIEGIKAKDKEDGK